MITDHIRFVLVEIISNNLGTTEKCLKSIQRCVLFVNHPQLFDLSDHLNKVHDINGQERKYWLSKAHYSMISSDAVHAHSSVPQSDSTPPQFGNSLPKNVLTN